MSDDEIFQDMRQQMRPSDELVGRVLDRVAAETSGPQTTQVGTRRLKAWAYLATAACLALAVVMVFSLRGGGPDQLVAEPATGTSQGSFGTTPGQGSTNDPNPAATGTVVSAESYGDVYKVVAASLASVRTRPYAVSGFVEDGLARDTALGAAPGDAAAAAPVPAPQESGAGEAQADKAAYSETNVQVAGIDEGDIVKTDGKVIYVASKKDVAIYRPDGANTTEIARLDTTDVMPEAATDPTQLSIPGAVLDMFINDSTLAVLVHDYQAEDVEVDATDPSTSVRLNATQTKVLLYDVSDPAKPKYLTALGQSGSYSASRLQNGILYLVSQYQLTDETAVNEADPATFAPLMMRASARTLPFPPGDIAVLPQTDTPTYAVASAVSLATGERLGQQAVLGGAETIYMSADNLYLAASRWDQTFALPASAEKAYGVEGKMNGSATHVARIALADGALKLEAEGTAPGNLVNQFALDEYEGHLRIATTIDGSIGKSGNQWINGAAVFVLDQGLDQVGSIWPLVTDETIRSVRFTGSVGYVVTFRQTDPLFAIDLAEPANPKVMSALKIPGFSTYLHPLGADRLLGLGFDGDEDGSIFGMKLSLFDISDPFNVSETQTMAIPQYNDSAALYDHKGVLVDKARGLVGFQVTGYGQNPYHYVVYGYDEGKGFHLIKDLALASGRTYSTATRGILIGDFLYICSASYVEVYNVGDYKNVANLTVNTFADESADIVPYLDDDVIVN